MLKQCQEMLRLGIGALLTSYRLPNRSRSGCTGEIRPSLLHVSFAGEPFFASLYSDSVDDDLTYSPDHVARCGDDLDFVTWLLGLDDDDPAFAKGQEIRKIAPSVACGEL